MNKYKGVWVRDDGDEFVVREIEADCYHLAEVPTPNTVLDVGGNIGAFSRDARRRWPHARIVSLEPEAGNFAMLTKNAAGRDIDARNLAVWPRSEPLWSHNTGGLSHCDTIAIDGVEVQTVSLDALVDELGGVDLLKVDTEGAEEQIFLGASHETMERIGMIVGEYHGMHAEWGEMMRWLGAHFARVEIAGHPWPNHLSGGLFWARR